MANILSFHAGRREGKTGYSNNFGEPLAGGNSVDGQIIFLLFKPLVTRFVESRKDMEGHENIVSFHDTCQGSFCECAQPMRDDVTI